jgi:YHS domain-containing protein
MTMYVKRLALLAAAFMFTCGVAWAQDHTHHTHGAPAAADATKCARAQPGIEKIISAAMARADAARQSNNPAELRAVLDQLAAALRDIRAQSAPCAASKDPDAGHMTAPSAAKQMDPVNGLMVDPATAPSTAYQGQTYYFSSEQSRKEFLENPSKFTKKPKG